MTPQLLLGLGVFVAVVLLVEAVYWTVQTAGAREARRVRGRLQRVAELAPEGAAPALERRTVLSAVPWLDRALRAVAPVRRLELLIEQANAPQTPAFYLLAAAVLGGACHVLALTVRPLRGLGPLLALAGALLPLLYLLSRRRARLARFERQLPEALELVARAMRAGHSFAGGLALAAGEFDDPVGTELQKTLGEINFGVGIPRALENLTRRVDCADLKFFAVAVIVQRETGGNLAEIIERIGHLIRERFRLQGKIRVLSAEGKLSALVVGALPFVVGAWIRVANPAYLDLLFTDPAGRVMLVGALGLLATGILVMYRMVQIRV